MVKNDVIFICHGNINRSRAAEEILKTLRPDLKIDSYAVGVKSKDGKIFTKKMRGVLEENGYYYDINKRSKVISLDDVIKSNLVFVMDNNNIKHFKLRFGDDYLHKLRLLGDVVNLGKIKDPGFSKGLSEYLECFKQIEECCNFISVNYEKF